MARRKRRPERRTRTTKRAVVLELPDGIIGLQPLGLAPLSPTNPLALSVEHQQQTQWCWAAVAISVNRFYHSTSGWTQCSLAGQALGQSTCCSSGGSAQCNQPWYLDRALQAVGDLASMNGGKAALSVVQAEIDNSRPLCLRIGWTGGGGHFVAIYGYSGASLNIGDPWYGNSIQDYAAFPDQYQGGGSWTHGYHTKA